MIGTDELPFAEVWCVDFEFVSRPGEHPDIVCLVAHEVRSGQTIRLWRDDMGAKPPYRIDEKALFVCYVANAECSCHLARWPLPKHILDLSPEFRCITNGLRLPGDETGKKNKPGRKGLLNALRHYGFDTLPAKQKDAMRDRIMQGFPFTEAEQEAILDYCESDVVALVKLLAAMVPDIDLRLALHRGEFVAACAVMEHHGIPIDGEIFGQLRDKETWTFIRDAMVPVIDQQYGIYVRGKDGVWSFNAKRFESYLASQGIEWPRLESGKLDLRDKTFESMAKAWTCLQDLRQLRHLQSKLRRIKLAVGHDNRNRTTLWTFTSKTSRTQPKASEWIFSPAVWLRSLIKPEPGMAVAYIDYSAMEFQIAAVLSDRHCGDHNPMLDMYLSGDPYTSYARSIGAMPADVAKPKEFRDDRGLVRDRFKVFLLAALYGMQARTLAGRLGIPEFEARQMLDQHHALFAQYWQWSDDWVARALRTGIMRTPFGWTCRTGLTETNERSIRNFPIQATGADILRVACVMGTRHNLRLLAPVHDAVLIEAPIERIEADVTLMREIMRRASRVVLSPNDGSRSYEIRTSVDIVRHPDRYIDGRGTEMWNQVMELLAQHEPGEELCRVRA